MSYIRQLSILSLVVLFLTITVRCFAASSTASNTFTGNNTAGPFVLTYKDISTGSELVFLNGMHQSRGRDYLIDYGAGIIAFNKMIATGQKINISYQYNPQSGARFGSMAPVAFNLLNGGNSSFQFTMTPKMAAEGGMALSTLGVQGSIKRGSNTIKSMFLVDPNSRNAQGGTDSLNMRSAMQFGSTFGLGGLKITGDFLHVGEKFQDAKALGLQQGVDARKLIAEWSPLKGMNLTASETRNEALTGKEKGKVDTASTQSLIYDYSKTGKFTALSENKETRLANGKVISSSVDQYRLTQSWNGFNLGLLDEKKSTSGTDKDDTWSTFRIDLNKALSKTTNFATSRTTVDSEKNGETTISTYDLASNLNPLTKLTLGFVTSDSEKSGESSRFTTGLTTRIHGLDFVANRTDSSSDAAGSEKATNLSVAGKLGTLNMNASVNDVDKEKGADVQTTKLGINTSISKATVSAGMTMTDTENAGEVMDTNLGVAVKGKDLTLSTGMVRKDTDNLGTETKINAELGTWGDKLKLTTSLVRNDYLSKDDYYSSSYGMALTPWKPLKLNAAIMEREAGAMSKQGYLAEAEIRLGGKAVNQLQSTSFEFFNTGIDLNQGERIALKGSVLQEPTADDSKITTISTKTKPMDGVLLGGFYKSREKNNAESLDTMVAAVQVSPIKQLEIVGNYETNPEVLKDKQIVVNPITRRLFGLKTNMGSLSLIGKYGSTENLQNGQSAQTRQYGMDLKLWDTTSLSAGLLQEDPMLGPTQNTYTLQFKRDLGERFTLALEGKVIARDQAGTQDDISASLKAGIRF